MEVFIGNPLNGDKAKVDSNGRLLTSSTSLTRYEESSADGRAILSISEVSQLQETTEFYI
jgi:hypothetical protein